MTKKIRLFSRCYYPHELSYILVLIGLAIITLFYRCSPVPEKPAISFYHWKSYYQINDNEQQYLDSLMVKRLYLRYFDVDIVDGQIAPVGKMILKNGYQYPHNIIPTVFISNRTFKKVAPDELDTLIEDIIKLITQKHQKITKSTIQEVQFDCDWSLKTKAIYFSFLQKIKNKSQWNISTTLRLHQIKYKEKTGIPPADSYVLMCYNTGTVEDINEANSILSAATLQQYTNRLSDYPHQLKIALPLFSWGVLFRDQKMIKLIRNIDQSIFINNPKFELKNQIIQVVKNTYLNGYYLYEGDMIRLEEITPEILNSCVNILKKHLSPKEIIYYHLDPKIINKFDYETLENINLHFTKH